MLVSFFSPLFPQEESNAIARMSVRNLMDFMDGDLFLCGEQK